MFGSIGGGKGGAAAAARGRRRGCVPSDSTGGVPVSGGREGGKGRVVRTRSNNTERVVCYVWGVQ